MRRRGLLRRAADRAELAAVRAAMGLTAPLSADRLARVAASLGRRISPRVPTLRRRVAENLRALRGGAEPDRAEVRALCAACGAEFAQTVAEYWRLPELAADPSRLSVTGADALAEALAGGRGAVIVTAHFGQWEAIRLAVRRVAGRDCALIYRAFNNPLVDAVAQANIRPAGEPVLHKGREGMRALLRHVAGGGAALILIDQRQTGAPLIPFLGVPAETATAAAELARRFGAALIPARGLRVGTGRFEAAFGPEIPPGEPEAMTAAANAALSEWIEAAPEQWLWFHRRWRRRPRGERMRAARGREAD